jgi:hypothetical protein
MRCAQCHRLQPPDRPLAFDPVCDACGVGGDASPHPVTPVHPLTTASVGDSVTHVAPGNFLLGYREGGTFSAFYVGRADADLGDELRSWVGASSLRSGSGGPCGLAP